MIPHSDSHANLQQDDEISLVEIWLALKQQKILILGVTFLSAAVAAAVAFTMTPIFQTAVVVALVEDGGKASGLGALKGQLGGLSSLAGFDTGGSSTRTDNLGTLGSNQLVAQYITAQKLLPVLFEEKWDASKGDWKSAVDKKPTLWQATQLFTKEVRKISEDKKTGLITVTVEWKDAVVATQWANDLVQLANQTLRQQAIEKSEANLAYLDSQLEKTSVIELRQAIYRLIESEVKNVMVATGSKDYAFKVIDPAVAPERKAKPKRSLIVGVGMMLGLMLSSIYAVAKSVKSLQVSRG